MFIYVRYLRTRLEFHAPFNSNELNFKRMKWSGEEIITQAKKKRHGTPLIDNQIHTRSPDAKSNETFANRERKEKNNTKLQ